MYKGIYIALSGAILKKKHMDIFAQNIANATTSGYKKERISFKDYLIPADNQHGFENDSRTMSVTSNIVTDFSKGTLIKTGNPLDLSINGEGFFALEGNRYTRNGNFKISSEGYLVTQDDIKVLGGGGPITVQGQKIDVSTSGEVIVDDTAVGTINVVNFTDRSVLLKLSGSTFVTDEPGENIKSNISQGYLEASNVDVIKEMVQMIMSLREFEAYQKMIHSFDEATAKTTNEMGR
jgi:flagellar basal-body rod protein FlgG